MLDVELCGQKAQLTETDADGNEKIVYTIPGYDFRTGLAALASFRDGYEMLRNNDKLDVYIIQRHKLTGAP